MENAAGRWEGKMKKPNWTWGDGLRASPTGQRLVHKISHCQGGGDILCKSKTKTLSYLISIFNVRGLNMGPSAGEVPVGLIFSVFSELVAERDKQDCISLSAPRALHGETGWGCTVGEIWLPKKEWCDDKNPLRTQLNFNRIITSNKVPRRRNVLNHFPN